MSLVSVADLQAALTGVFSEWVRQLELRVLDAGDGEARLELPVAARHVHAGGVMCGQSLMSAADTAMVLAVMTRLGGFKPMTTVQLQTSFIRAVPADAGTVQVHARVLRLARTLVFGEVLLSLPDGRLAAHTTTTYALL